jgi:hypothetical protein
MCKHYYCHIFIIIIIIIIIYIKLRVGFHPVAVALQNDKQIKYNTQIKHITYRIQITYTSNTQNIHIKYTTLKHTYIHSYILSYTIFPLMLK